MLGLLGEPQAKLRTPILRSPAQAWERPRSKLQWIYAGRNAAANCDGNTARDGPVQRQRPMTPPKLRINRLTLATDQWERA